jgi:hypothetical protein
MEERVKSNFHLLIPLTEFFFLSIHDNPFDCFIATEGLNHLGPCSSLTAVDEQAIFIIPQPL